MGVSSKDENSFAPGVIYIDFDLLFLLGLIASIVPLGSFLIRPTLFVLI